MGEIQPKGLLLDQEKVTRVDFSLKGGKKDRDTVHIVEIKIEKRKITKDNTISNL